MGFSVIIPARYASSRLPAKLLRDINGKSLIEHTYLNAVRSDASRVIIATDDKRIKNIAEGSFQRQGYRPKTKKRKQIYILQGLPGIGRQRAERLLDAFGSVEAVITASCEDLQSVNGIGAGVAEKIRWMVSEKMSDYGDNNHFFI